MLRKKHINRSLSQLYKAGSTSRVLNLIKINNNFQDNSIEVERPFFHANILNKSFVIKHRLRDHELEIFNNSKIQATKIIIPLDRGSLSLGGQYLFIDQADFFDAISNYAGHRIEQNQHDVELLRLLDEIPSFDPFILREWVRRRGLVIDSRYFDLDDVAARSMESFVTDELRRLVVQALDGVNTSGAVARLVQKLLASNYDQDLQPFRTAFGFSAEQFPELMFCWKGFLYYKWLGIGVEADLRKTLNDLLLIKLADRDEMIADAVNKSRKLIRNTAAGYFNQSVALIDEYDSAFAEMIDAGQGRKFREFLLESPQKFLKLGEANGVLRHIIQFWQFRFPKGPPRSVRSEDFLELLRDFEDGLGSNPVTSN